MQISLSSCDNSGANICSDRDLSDLDYTGTIVLLIEYSSKLLVFDLSNDGVGIFVTGFPPTF